MGNYSSTGKEVITGTNAQGEPSTHIGTGSKFNWGLMLIPKVGIKIDNAFPSLGLSYGWTKGADKVGIGFVAGIAFTI